MVARASVPLALVLAAAFMSAAAPARAQYYGVLNDTALQLTGTCVLEGTLNDATLQNYAVNYNVNFGSVTPPDNGNTNFSAAPIDFVLQSSGYPVEAFTGSLPLGSYYGYQLPSIPVTGSLVHDTLGTFEMSGDLPTYSACFYGFCGTLTDTTMQLTGVDPDPFCLIDCMVDITSTQFGPMNTTLTGTYENQPVTFDITEFGFTSWEITQIPAPPAVAIFLPGIAGSLTLLRRRRS
jgi:hypothetical protein